MESLFTVLVVVIAVLLTVSKKKGVKNTPSSVDNVRQEPSAMPHKHPKEGSHVSFSGKTTHNTKSGSMPHKHEKNKYKSMADASKLPPGYILLNGEPVRVADLEGK